MHKPLTITSHQYASITGFYEVFGYDDELDEFMKMVKNKEIIIRDSGDIGSIEFECGIYVVTVDTMGKVHKRECYIE